MPARAIGLAVRYSERLVAEQLGNTTFGTARHITTTLTSAPTKGDTADGDKPSQEKGGRGLILSTEPPEQHNC